MNPARVAVIGACGRMGREVAALVHEAPDLVLASAIERSGHPDLGHVVGGIEVSAAPPSAPIEALIDFSAPSAVRASAGMARSLGAGLVVGSTGLSAEDESILREAALDIAIVRAANMAIGVQVLYRVVRLAARLLRDYDVEVVEMHHRGKADAPSGTAAEIVRVLRQERGAGTEAHGRHAGKRGGPEEIGVHALRGGDITGDHEVILAGDGEAIRIGHRATSRRAFATGALRAVRFVIGSKPGLYGMDDVVGAAS